MPEEIQQFLRPSDLPEACKLLREGGGHRVPLAGGTTLARRRPPGVNGLVDLSRLGLDFIRDGLRGDVGAGVLDFEHRVGHGDGVFIGSTVTAERLASCEAVRAVAGGIVARAAAGLESTPLRSRTTLGGNAARGAPWSPLVTALLAVDGVVRISAGHSSRDLEAVEFFREPQAGKLLPGELILGVLLPKGLAAWRGAFTSLRRTSFDESFLDLALALHLERGLLRAVRIAIGASGYAPRRFPEVEGRMLGQPPSPALFAEAGELLALRAALPGDHRASRDYLKKILPVVFARAGQEAVSGPPEGSGVWS